MINFVFFGFIEILLKLKKWKKEKEKVFYLISFEIDWNLYSFYTLIILFKRLIEHNANKNCANTNYGHWSNIKKNLSLLFKVSLLHIKSNIGLLVWCIVWYFVNYWLEWIDKQINKQVYLQLLWWMWNGGDWLHNGYNEVIM